ncbi:unnamed protein product [Leptidea sinapis]|uniref:MADF domain-containing protein n=1 Tax=Leptidea sinapis TaxID=189913 RepID=A0A5E4R542_9NEOP|nr:unnamed protein product [Leptidea sinapis]
MRASALGQLRVGMNIEALTIDEVKSKIKSIRNTYYLELDKIEKSGCVKRKPKAKWFDEYDSFVKPVSIRRKTIDNMNTPNSNESGSSNSNEPRPSLVPRSENGLENESAEETPRFSPPTKPKQGKLSQISNMINDLREINDNTQYEEADLDLFGKSVSAQMKKLTEEQAVIAKEKIQKYRVLLIVATPDSLPAASLPPHTKLLFFRDG